MKSPQAGDSRRNGEIANQPGPGRAGPAGAKAEVGVMNCADFEILICDYVDGTLTAERKSAVERHLAQCPACAELARDSAAAVAFMERAAEVEPPPELITRILFEAPWSKDRSSRRRAKLAGRNPRPGVAAAVRDGHGDDCSFAVLAGSVHGARAAVAYVGPGAGRGVGGDRGPRLSRLGAHGKVLRQSEVRVPDSNHPAGMAAAGRRSAAAPVRRLPSGKRTSTSCQSKAIRTSGALPAPRPAEGQLRIPRRDRVKGVRYELPESS